MSTDLQDVASLAATAASSAAQEVAASSSSPGPLVNAVGESLQCLWQGCGERTSNAEALYEHVCERHIGRKSTNNLCLTCAWAQCRTVTVKRDHITSHIRVHIPLKPHKCEFCTKAFKRPQDLKKHVKTHADESVLNRSPDPSSARNNTTLTHGGDYHSPYYNHAVGTQASQASQAGYYAPAMAPDAYSGHYANQYYPATQTGQQYGPVTYQTVPTQQYDFEARKRGMDAIDTFFGEVRRREVDPNDYAAVTRRLLELQGLQLPQIVPSNPTVPAYQSVTTVGGGYEQADPIQAYSLPPMGNAKSREDLTSIDKILADMQQTIYDNDSHLHRNNPMSSSAYVGYNTGYQTSDSPASSLSANPLHVHQSSISDVSTPELSTPSSAGSYVSGHSPLPSAGHNGGMPLYPTLPGSGPTDFDSLAAHAAQIGSMYGSDRRYMGGGLLQRARPDKSDDGMDVGSEGSATPPASVINKENAAKSDNKGKSPTGDLIDPALAEEESKAEKDNEEWLANLKLIEWMREFIKNRLDAGDDAGKISEDLVKIDRNELQDTEMNDARADAEEAERKEDEEHLYPVLQQLREQDV